MLNRKILIKIFRSLFSWPCHMALCVHLSSLFWNVGTSIWNNIIWNLHWYEFMNGRKTGPRSTSLVSRRTRNSRICLWKNQVLFEDYSSFHVYSWICKSDNIHIGPLDEWTCQIVPLIILKHATMTLNMIWFHTVYLDIYLNKYTHVFRCSYFAGVKELNNMFLYLYRGGYGARWYGCLWVKPRLVFSFYPCLGGPVLFAHPWGAAFKVPQ